MLFSSFSFLFLFFPITLLVSLISKNIKFKNIVLLIASLIFYAWGEPIYILLMIMMIVINYFLALFIDKSQNKSSLVIAIIINVGLIAFFKYSGFIFETINFIFKTQIVFNSPALPIGISFYTFQIMSYLVDVYRKDVKAQKNMIIFACYVSLFPQLIAGPIVRYKDVEKELINREITIDKLSNGLRRFIIGLGKKIIIANNVAIIANKVFSMNTTDLTFSAAWIGVLCFSIQIYFDFSGYSDMAIGLGEMFGFHFLENFNYPYISKSITDFWRRWHMSLSSWFKDYVYIPLGGNRCSKPRWVLNMFIVWACTGLWHGASWNFVCWGIYFFALLIVEKFTHNFLERIPFLNHLITIFLLMIGWTIFNCTDFNQMGAFLSTMLLKPTLFDFGILSKLNVAYLTPYIIIGIILSTPIFKILNEKLHNKQMTLLIKDIGCLCILVLCLLFLINSTYNPFIYFRF